jgi:2-hydroxychromene-2-carboxylate isomerase
MFLRNWLMPAISQHLLARSRLLQKRASAEQKRSKYGLRHQLHYFHQVDDPYSALTAFALPALLARYDLELIPHVVSPPANDAAPEREKLIAYSRQDAQQLARHHGLTFSDRDAQPNALSLDWTTARLVKALSTGRFAELAGPLSATLWRPEAMPPEQALDSALSDLATSAEVAAHLDASTSLRQKLGHYLGATFYYAGEWYWGIDRLHHLERRLQTLGLAQHGVEGLMFAPDEDLQAIQPSTSPTPIDFFFSLRSPYTAIVAERVFSLGRLTGAPVRLRYVLPMVMRGLSVPRNKRMYIALDTAREAFERNIPFGRLNDPVGRPTERGLSLMPYAEREGLGQRYVLSFLRGVWAEGLDAGSDRGLRTIVERAGLSWPQARLELNNAAWRKVAEDNRAELFSLGLWGVPSFRVGDFAVWGQDRLWAVQEALLASTQSTEEQKR